jgi:S-adenosyl-L-methionine hydrolase (adenosine-forming)
VSSARKDRPRPRPAPSTSRVAPIVSLLTDFGERDGFVGIMKGVVLGICPDARLVDLSHEVAPQDVMGAALVLRNAIGHFPPGTIHLGVVDPGVGTARRPILIETERFVLIGPDNGLLSLAAEQASVRQVVHLDRPQWFLPSLSSTFHGRDVFAPVAGHCASGVEPRELGSRLEGFERLSLAAPRWLDDAIEAQVIHVDRFGNLTCNLRHDEFASSLATGVSISVGGVQISGISQHYSTVREGKPVALWNSWGYLEIAIRNGSAARHLRSRIGDRVQLKLSR